MSLFPVAAVLDEIIDALHRSPQAILNAPTGAGKSTWLPLQLLERMALSGKIILLEPRRLAARNVAARLAQQLGEPIGRRVGYRMRGDSCVSGQTQLEVVTEGILTRMLQQDAELAGVSLVILDEFHERSLHTDLALTLLLDVQNGLRDDLKLLVMSATLDNAQLSGLLPDAPQISTQGRSFPVTRHYHPLSPHARFEQEVSNVVLSILCQETGSLLLFLPGVNEIQRVATLLLQSVDTRVDICPLYGTLSMAEQQRAIEPASDGRRKVVLATNIAQTSLTIEGIRLVVDTALARVSQFDVRNGFTRLVTQRASQAAMTQRAGRAGRLQAGICWHLISREQAERAAEQTAPEILHSDLSALYLELLLWGCQDSSQLCWLDKPPQPALIVAKKLLWQLGAVDEQGRLSEMGRAMGRVGCEPRLAAMLCAAKQHSANALATAALLTAIIEQPPRQGQSDLRHALYHPQDHWRRRATQLMNRLGLSTGVVCVDNAAYWLAQAYPDRIASRRKNAARYLLSNGMGAALSPDDALAREAGLIIPVLQQGANQNEARIILALPCDILALAQALPKLTCEQTCAEWDEVKGTLRVLRRHQLGQLVLHAQPLAKPSAQHAVQALLAWIRTNGIASLPWRDEAQQLRIRLACAARWLPEMHWPAMDDHVLLDTLEQWLSPVLQDVKDLRGLAHINLYQALLQCLDWQQRQQLERELPTHYQVATGSRLPIQYFADKAPLLSVRLQEMLGEQHSPRVAGGRIVVTLALLSPAQRPLQITSDLAGFWAGAYADVKKEMKGRYPKHAWPDDPATALPTRRTKRYQG